MPLTSDSPASYDVEGSWESMKKDFLKFLIGIAAAVVVGSLPFITRAADTRWIDTGFLTSYSTGDLDGQNGWDAYPFSCANGGTGWQVVDDATASSTRAIRNVTAGTSCYLPPQTSPTSTIGAIGYDSVSISYQAKIESYSGNQTHLQTFVSDQTGHMAYIDWSSSGGTGTATLQTAVSQTLSSSSLPTDTWITFQFEIDVLNNLIRARVPAYGGWSDWVAGAGGRAMEDIWLFGAYREGGSSGVPRITNVDFTFPENSVALDYPDDQQTLEGDFTHWQVLVHIVEPSWDITDIERVDIIYTGVLNGEGVSYTDTTLGRGFGFVAEGNGYYRSFLPKLRRSGSGEWTALPLIKLYDVDDLVFGPEITFNITTNRLIDTSFEAVGGIETGGFFPENILGDALTDTSNLFYFDCSDYDSVGFLDAGSWAKMMCYAWKYTLAGVQFLIVPHDVSQTFVAANFNSFKDVFPFNLFYGVVDEVESVVLNMNNSEELGLSYRYGFDDYSVVLFTSSSLVDARYGDTTLRNWWYNLIMMLLVVGFVFYVIMVIYHSI